MRGALPHRSSRVDNGAARLLPVATTLLAAIDRCCRAAARLCCADPSLHPDGGLSLDDLSARSAAAAGALRDRYGRRICCGGAPGVTALVLLLARARLLKFRRHFVNRPFPFVWTGFTLLTGGAMLGLWAVHSLLAAELLDFAQHGLSWGADGRDLSARELPAGPQPARADDLGRDGGAARDTSLQAADPAGGDPRRGQACFSALWPGACTSCRFSTRIATPSLPTRTASTCGCSRRRAGAFSTASASRSPTTARIIASSSSPSRPATSRRRSTRSPR